MKKKTFLVTGGTGFIGSNISKLLIQIKHKVIVFDMSANHLIFGDGVGAVLGDDSDFIIQHTSGGNFFEGAGSGSPVYIRSKVNENANIIFGSSIDESLEGIINISVSNVNSFEDYKKIQKVIENLVGLRDMDFSRFDIDTFQK